MAASRTLHGPPEDALGLRAGLTAVHRRMLMAESRTHRGPLEDTYG
jgi:hypothetical protein